MSSNTRSGPAAAVATRRAAGVRAEHRLERVRIELDARDHLAAVEARSAFADVGRLEHQHLAPGFRQVQRRRESGVAGADDCRLRALRALRAWLHAGPGGAVTDHSDCSGTADIASSIIDCSLS